MEPLENILFQHLTYACSEIRQAFDQQVGMSQPRRQLLVFLSQQGEVSHATLQQHLTLDGATITRLVKQFEAEDILARRLDPQDNRYTLVSLTAHGQQIVAGLSATHHQFQLRLLDGITRDDQEIMIRTLERLRSNVHAIKGASQEGE